MTPPLFPSCTATTVCEGNKGGRRGEGRGREEERVRKGREGKGETPKGWFTPPYSKS